MYIDLNIFISFLPKEIPENRNVEYSHQKKKLGTLDEVVNDGIQ